MKLKMVILTSDARSIGGHTSFSNNIRGQEDFLIEYNEEMRMVTVTTGKGQFIIPLTSISHMQADDEVKSLVVPRRKRSKIVKKADRKKDAGPLTPEPVRAAAVTKTAVV